MLESLLRIEVLLFILVNAICGVAFVVNMRNTLKEVGRKHRQIAPKKVWRLLIPIYNFFYLFYLVHKVSNSLFTEFAAHKWNTKPVVALYHLGMIMGALSILMFLPISNVFFWFCFTIAFFLYWMGLFIVRNFMKEQHQSQLS